MEDGLTAGIHKIAAAFVHAMKRLKNPVVTLPTLRVLLGGALHFKNESVLKLLSYIIN